MYMKMLLITSILIIGGCAEKTDFTKGVSEKDKKLFSSKEGRLYLYEGRIAITKDGFYPYNRDMYKTKVASYLDVKRFNLKLFISDVYANDLKNLREKLLIMTKRYPDFRLNSFTPKEIKKLESLPLHNIKKYYPNLNLESFKVKEMEKLVHLPLHIIKNDFPKLSLSSLKIDDIEKLTSSSLSLKEKHRVILTRIASFYKKIPNLDKDLELFAKKRICHGKSYESGYSSYIYTWKNNTCKEKVHSYSPSNNSNPEERSSSGNSGSYSTQNFGCRIQTVYVPGGNGRTAQTRICN